MSQLEHPAPFAARWRGAWIWHRRPRIDLPTASRPVPAEPVDTVALLRRSIDVVVPVSSAPARLWTDGRYLLCVNGREVARGPVRADPRRAHYDIVDLAEHLVVGENVIAVTARHYGTPTSWWTPVTPSYSLGVGCMAFEAQIGEEWVVSDTSWRTAPGAAWSPVPVPGDVASLPLEDFDATLHPVGWDTPGFDDTSWRQAIEITPVHTGGGAHTTPPSEPFGMLRPPVRIAQPGGARHVAEARQRRRVVGVEPLADPVAQVLADQTTDDGAEGTEATVELRAFDLGRVAAGTVELVVSGAAAGTVIDVAVAEHLDDDGRLVTLGQHAGFRYRCRGGDEERFTTFDLVGGRHLLAAIRGPAGAISLAVQDRLRPRPELALFSCSDPLLEQIHAVGLRTVDLCALDAYVDCPSREQRAWTGDSVVHQMVDLVTNPDWSMARWHPQLAASPRDDGMLAMAPASDFWLADGTMVPDWSLHWVRSVHNLFRYTGDARLIAELMPVAERVLRWFESYLGDDGLLHDVSGWLLIDWASVYSAGCSSTLNALWARGLEDLADMARWLGNQGTASWAEEARARVAGCFDVFWDEERAVYVDHLIDGVAQRPAAQHPGAAALAAGLVPEARLDRVVAGLTDRTRLIKHSFVMQSMNVEGGGMDVGPLIHGMPPPAWDAETEMVEAEPFFRYVLHDGLARAGRADLIAGMLADWGWFLDRGETTWPECWLGGTRCHGWSSTPTRDLIVHVLGISPAEPGYTSVRVAPALGGLEWARATVPTPHGPVAVEAHADGAVDIRSPVPVRRD